MASSLFKGQKNLQNNINQNVIAQAKSMMNNLGQMNGIMSMLSGKGMNPEQAVRSICKERGIDVDEFMNSLKGK
jgi:hypothetical protein|nr:MAG TPA: Raf-like Ras-binding domain [Caudoviricetes sp.]